MHAPSDYIIYVDESGTPMRRKIDPSFPIFSLQLLVISKADYAEFVAGPLVNFKLKHHQTDSVILRGSDMRRREGDFEFLNDPLKANPYLVELTELIGRIPMRLYSAFWLHDEAMVLSGLGIIDPYAHFLKRLLAFVSNEINDGSTSKTSCRVLVESRHDSDAKMLQAFDLYRASLDNSGVHYEIEMVKKEANVLGLQLVDLVALPVAHSCLNPEKTGRDWLAIRDKVVCRLNLTPEIQFFLDESMLG
jgi:hypothetical protein